MDRRGGNRSGLVGRYFMTHSIASVYGFFDDEETENYMGVTGAQATNMDHYGKQSLGDGAFGSLQWQLAPTMKPNDLLGVAMARADLFGLISPHSWNARCITSRSCSASAKVCPCSKTGSNFPSAPGPAG